MNATRETGSEALVGSDLCRPRHRSRTAAPGQEAPNPRKRLRTTTCSDDDSTYNSAAQVSSQRKRHASEYRRGGIDSHEERTDLCSETTSSFASIEAPQLLGSGPNMPVDTSFMETSDNTYIYGRKSVFNQIANDPPSEIFAARRWGVDQEEQCDRLAIERKW